MDIGGTAIRQATVEDVTALANCWRAMVDEVAMAPGGFRPDWRERLERFFGQGIAAGAQGWFVAIGPGGRIVASAGALMNETSLVQNEPVVTIAGVYVAPDFRRLGVARELTMRALAWARAEGCRIARLTPSQPAERLYRDLGFTDGRELLLRLG
jgi:GNAT superfamily N-acetyltransferase